MRCRTDTECSLSSRVPRQTQFLSLSRLSGLKSASRNGFSGSISANSTSTCFRRVGFVLRSLSRNSAIQSNPKPCAAHPTLATDPF